MPLSYKDVLTQWDRSRAFGDPRDLSTFASEMNVRTGTQDYSEGLRDGWWTRASTRADQYVFDPIAEYTTKPLFGALGEAVGHGDIGEQVGAGIPRGLAETIPLFAAEFFSGGAATPAVLPLLLGSAATGTLMGAHTYAETGNTAASVISGTAGALVPGFGKIGGNIGARLAGASRVTGRIGEGFFDELIPEAAKDYAKVTTSRFLGSQTGMLVPNVAANVAQQRLMNPDQSVDWEKVGVETVISQIPFTVWDAVKVARAPKTTAEQIRPLLEKPQTKVKPYEVPVSSEEQYAERDAVLEQLQEVALNEAATPEEKSDALAAALGVVKETKGAIKLKRVTGGDKPQAGVDIAGFGRKQTNGSWKVLVDDVQTAAQLGVEPGQTVFINGAEPNPAKDAQGRQVWTIDASKINTNVTSPLKYEHFGISRDPNQPELPKQPVEWSGFSHDELETLKQNGVEPAKVDPMFDPVQNPQGTMAAIAEIQKRNAPLVPIAHALEETGARLSESQQKITAVPRKAEEIPNVFEIPTVEAVRKATELVGETELRSRAEKELVGLEGMNPEDAKAYALEVSARNVLQERQHVAAKEYVERGATPTQAVEKVRLQTQTSVVDSSQQQISILRDQAKTISEFRGKPQNQYGEAIRDEKGKNFTSRLEAETHLEYLKSKNPEDKTEYVVRDAGKGKGFYIAPVINREVSLEGTGLADVLQAPEPEHEFIAGHITPEQTNLGVQTLLQQLDIAGRNIGEFSKFLEHRDPARALEELKIYRQYLQDTLAGKEPKTTRAQDARRKEISLALLESREALQKFALKHRDFTLGSEMPHDPELVKEIGFQDRGVNAALDWFTTQPDAGWHGTFMSEVRKAIDFSGIQLDYNFRDGWFYQNGRINVPFLPNRQNVHLWMESFNHELGHHAMVDLVKRNDPVAVKFKATLKEGMEAVRNSPLIPKEVRKAFAQFPEWFREHSLEGSEESLVKKWHEVVGKAHDEWIGVVYGLQNHDEFVAQMHGSPKMVEVMKGTKMPRTVGQTVMQFLSKAWNAVFGGKSEMDSVLEQVLSSFDNYLGGGALAKTVERVRPEISAGPGFLFSLAPYDVTRNVLGGKHTLPKGGVIQESQLKTMGGVNKPLTDGEIELYRHLVPEAFVKGPNFLKNETREGSFVNVPKLVEGLKKNGSVVEVRKLGGLPSEHVSQNARAQVQHWLDSTRPEWVLDEEGLVRDLSGEMVPNSLIPTFIQDRLELVRGDAPTEGARYSFLGPKPEGEMSGYVEGLVRVPTKLEQKGPTTQVSPKGAYVGPHFGIEDLNVLSFFRGYEETLPSGEKTFHVIEVQSDWGQRQRENDEAWRKEGYRSEAEAKSAGKITESLGHPLLRVYNELALKAAIQHAKEIGATKVILSDAETAMMTEGHDRVARPMLQKSGFTTEQQAHDFRRVHLEATGELFDVRKIGENQFEVWSKPVPSQEKGMRLHYDTLLPSTMEKLTGVKGERVEMGVHKQAGAPLEPDTLSDEATDFSNGPVGSPVFRDASGNPKTQITGRVYDISKVPDEMPLVDASSRVPEQVKIKTPSYTGRDYLRDALIAEGVRPEALTSRIQTVEAVFKTGDLVASVDGFTREAQNDILPATAEKGEIVPALKDSLSGEPSAITDATMNLLADSVPAHQELWNRMREDLEIAKNLYQNIKKGLVPGILPENIGENLRYAQVKLNAMKKALDKQALAIERLGYTNNFTYDGIEKLAASQLTNRRLPGPPDPTGMEDEAHALMGLRSVQEVRRESSLKELKGEKELGFLTRMFMFTQFTKQLHPEIRPVVNHVEEHVGKSQERIDILNLTYANDPDNPGTFSPKVMESNMRVARTESLQKTASDIYRQTNIWEQERKQWSWFDKPIQDMLKRFNQSDRDAIKLEHDSQRARYHVRTEQILPQALSELNINQTARVIAAFEVGMLPESARQISQKIYDSLAAIKLDPVQGIAATEVLRQIGTQMQPETFMRALKHAQGIIQATEKFLALARERPSFVSEQRFDKYHLVMRGPEGQPFRAPSDSLSELNKIRLQKEREGYRYLDTVPKSDANVPAGGVNKDLLDAMGELDIQHVNSLDNALTGVDPVVRDKAFSAAMRAQQYSASAEAFKPTPNLHRKFIEGREYLNMIDNANTFYIKENNWLRHRLIEATTSLDMLHPEIAGNRSLKEYANTIVQNVLTPDNPHFRKLVEATYFQRLAFSLGNSLLEFLQTWTTGMQSVIHETGSVKDAIGYVGAATKEVWGFNTKREWSNPELSEFMEKAALRGLTTHSQWTDILDQETEKVTSILRHQGNFATKPFVSLYYGARKWSTLFQRYNDRVGMVAGYMLGKEKGLTGDELFQFAADVKNRGLYTGGKPQRSVGLWSIKTKPVPQMLSALNSYTLGWFSQMARDWQVGFGGHPGDFTPQQRQGAKKAFLYGLGAQAVLAGALGLPGVGQGMSLLKQATGVDLKGQLRGTLAQLFGEDQENGGLLTNLALRGGLAGVTPIDPSNRAAVSFPFVGIDPYKGFDLSQLMGAPGATVSDAVQGLLAAGRGDFVGFQKLLPSVLRPTMGLIQGEGDVRDRRGTLLQTLSPAERFFTAVGLPSSRIQAARDTSEAVKNLNTAAQQQRQTLVDQLAELTRNGHLAEVQQKLVSLREQDPEVDLRSVVRSIAGRVEAQTIPYDYRRDLNVAADLHGFGNRMPSTELQRMELRNQVEQNLGLYSRPNPREVQRAIDIDTLLNSDPYQSRAGAIRHSEGLRRVRSRMNELYFPVSQ